jgi:imidazolonepropionase-like amidohydrolase
MAAWTRTLLVVTALLTGCAAAGLPAQPNPYQATTAFVGVSVLPMDKETVVSNQTVIVSQQKITWVGPAGSANIPEGASRVDGKGMFLMPGLAEMHAHIPGGKSPDSAVERTLFLYVANGVTTIRGMLGEARHLSYRSRVASGEVLGPRIHTTGPSFNGKTASTPAAAVEAVIAQKKMSYDLLKIHPGVPLAAFDALAAKAHELKIPFAGHVPAEVGLHRALKAGYGSIDHLDGYVEALAKSGAPPSQFFGVNLMTHVDEAGIPALVKATRAANTWQVPTEVLLDNLIGDDTSEALAARPEMKYVLQQTDIQNWIKSRQDFQKTPPAERRKLLSIRRRLIKEMHDAGVPFALGSDAPQMWNVPGFSIHRELQSLIDAGLTPYQALKTGTVNVGVYFGTSDGVVAAGRRADLVLLEANPLQNIANSTRIAGVVVNGRWLSKAEIDRRLASGN